MNIIRKNPALAVGIGLPLILVVLFAIATILPAWMVDPPKYDAVFWATTNVYTPTSSMNGEFIFQISNGHLKAMRRNPAKGVPNTNTQLFVYDAQSMNVSEIALPTAADTAGDAWQEFTVPELASTTLDPRTISRDGYEFHSRSNYNSNGDFWPFGGGYSSREFYSLGKEGREVKLHLPDYNYINSYGVLHFLGWVVAGDVK